LNFCEQKLGRGLKAGADPEVGMHFVEKVEDQKRGTKYHDNLRNDSFIRVTC